jgi:hypothetical protein
VGLEKRGTGLSTRLGQGQDLTADLWQRQPSADLTVEVGIGHIRDE